MRARTRECWQEATFRANGLAVSQETTGDPVFGGWLDRPGGMARLHPHPPGAETGSGGLCSSCPSGVKLLSQGPRDPLQWVRDRELPLGDVPQGLHICFRL